MSTNKQLATIAKLTGRPVAMVEPTTLRQRIEGTQQRMAGEWTALHEEACDALAHASVHGDYTLLAFMYAGHKAPVRKALAGWLGTCSPLVVSGGQIRKSKLPEAPAYNVPVALANPVADHKATPEEAEAFALSQLAKMLAKKADAREGTITEDAKRVATKLHRMVLDEIAKTGDGEGKKALADEAAKREKHNARVAKGTKALIASRKAQAEAKAKIAAAESGVVGAGIGA